MPDEIFPRYPPASWQVPGRALITFLVEDIQEDGGNRLVAHERPYRDGAKHDDTGSRAKRWAITSPSYNDHTEEGVEQNQYPAVLNALIDSFDVHETGTLTLPTRGAVR
ncbi:MAG TPA: DNA circularization N-terminal domain-containing protein, partial [Vicinamibacterales bacterium]|nr:DNA circularization N-terminal domain-containing protein [Vicinamibacterales bacterium]